MSNAFFLVHSWYPENSPPQRRIEAFAREWLVDHSSSTIICSKADPKYLAGDIRRKNPTQARNLGDPRIHVIESLSMFSSQSILSRIFNQAIACITGTVLGIHFGSSSHTRPNVVVATVPTLPTAAMGWVIATRFRAPLVIDLRDAWPDLVSSINLWNKTGKSPSFRDRLSHSLVHALTAIGAFVFERILHSADHVVTTSARLEESLRKRGIARITTVRNSYSSVGVKARLPRPTSEYTPEQSRLKILYAGTVGRAQGLSNAVEAAAIASQAGVELKLVILGSGAELDLVRSQARELSHVVTFVDRVSRSETAAYYEWADACLVHLQDWPALECTVPSKLIEIMYRRIPVCLSANGESAEIVRDTGAGESVSAMDPQALANLWTHWANLGVPEPDSARISEWLETNADPSSSSRDFVRILAELQR